MAHVRYVTRRKSVCVQAASRWHRAGGRSAEDGQRQDHAKISAQRAPDDRQAVRPAAASSSSPRVLWNLRPCLRQRSNFGGGLNRIASAVLAIAIPSVTRRYCVKTTARSTVQFALSDSKMCLSFVTRNIIQGRPLPPEI